MLKEGRPGRIFSNGLLVNESFECNIKYSQQIQLKVTGCPNWKKKLEEHIEYSNVWKLLIISKFKGSSFLPVRYTHDPWFSWNCISMFISSRITLFYSFQAKNFLGEDPPTPPSTVSSLTHYYYWYNAKTIMSDVFLCCTNTRFNG